MLGGAMIYSMVHPGWWVKGIHPLSLSIWIHTCSQLTLVHAYSYFLLAWDRFTYHALHWPNSSIHFKHIHNDPVEDNTFLEQLAFGIFPWARHGPKSHLPHFNLRCFFFSTRSHQCSHSGCATASCRPGHQTTFELGRISVCCCFLCLSSMEFCGTLQQKAYLLKHWDFKFMRIWEDLLANGGLVRESPHNAKCPSNSGLGITTLLRSFKL